MRGSGGVCEGEGEWGRVGDGRVSKDYLHQYQ